MTVPTPPPLWNILGSLMLASAFLWLITGWPFFGVCGLLLAPITLVALLAWALRGPFYNPFDPD